MSREDAKEAIVIPFFAEKEKVGQLTIPAGAIPPGCRIRIRQGENPDSSKVASAPSSKSDCGEKDKNKRKDTGDLQQRSLGSVMVRLSLEGDCKGLNKENPKFDDPLLLQLVGLSEFGGEKVTRKNSCVGYYNEDDSADSKVKSERTHWTCLPQSSKDFSISDYRQDRRLNDYEVKLDHFTTFAVLLGNLSPNDGGDSGGCGGSDILWILSIAMIGTAIVLSILLIFLYYRNQRVRAFFGGHFGKSINDLTRLVAQKSIISQSTTNLPTMPRPTLSSV